MDLQAKVVSTINWQSSNNGASNWGTQVALGDFNFDGLIDFAVNVNDNDEKTSDLRIFLAISSGTFEDSTSRLNINVPTYQTSNFLTADANNDGFTDIFISRSLGDGDTKNGVYPDSQLIYLSDGKGAFKAFTSEKLIYAHNVMLADVNGDSLVDAFYFATAIGPSILAINKFDEANDFLFTSSGLPDKAFYGGGRGENSWDVIERRSDGSPTILKGFHQHNTAFNDVNRDGKLDMVMFFAGSKEGRIYFNRGGETPLFASNDFVEFNSVITGFPSAGHFLYPIYGPGEKWGSNTQIRTIKQGMNYYESIQFDVDGDGWQDVIAVGTYENQDNISGGPYLNGTDRFNHGTLYQVLINQNSRLEDQTDLRIKQPKVNFNTNYHYGHFTMLSAVDLNGDGHLDFTSNMSSGSPIGTRTGAGDSATIFMLNDGKGNFSETTIQGLEYGSFNPIVVNGKLGFIHVTTAGYDWQYRVNRTNTEGTIIETSIPWTTGESGNDHLYGTSANDKIDGNAGNDVYHANGRINKFTIQKSNGIFKIRDLDGLTGSDTLINVENIKFADKTINLTVQAKAASAPQADVTRLVELYTAFFNRVPDADGMSFWIDEMKSGKTVNQVAESFYNAGVNYFSLTGFSSTMKNADFINVIYKNVLGRKDGADAGGLSFWDGVLTSGQASRGTLVTNILDSAHSFKGDKTWGWVADLLDNKITVAKKFSIDMGLNYNTPEESITKGMAIASAITATDTSAAVTLIGVTEANLLLV